MNQHLVPVNSLLGCTDFQELSPFFIQKVVITQCPPQSNEKEKVSSQMLQHSKSDSDAVNVGLDSRKRMYNEMNKIANEVMQTKKRIKVLHPMETIVKKNQISKASVSPFQKQKIIKKSQPPPDDNNDCSNMFGFRVSMKSLLQNEQIRQRLAPFIEKEVILVDLPDSDIEKRKILSTQPLLKKKKSQQCMQKQIIKNQVNSSQENEEIQTEELLIEEIIIPESSHVPDILEIEENITIGDNINLINDVAQVEESIDNNLPIIKEVTSIRDHPITYVEEGPDVELSNISVVEETGNIIENVIGNIIEKSLTKENDVVQNKRDSNAEVVPVLDLIESSDDEVIVCPDIEKSNEKVPKLTSRNKKQTNKISRRKRKSYCTNNTAGNNSVIVLENEEAIENSNTTVDEDHDKPILESDDWYYLNIANNPEAVNSEPVTENSVTSNSNIANNLEVVQIENSEPVTENSVASSLYESDQNDERRKTKKVKVLKVKRKRRKGRVSMVRKQHMKKLTETDNVDVILDKKSAHVSVPNLTESGNNVLNNAEIPIETSIITQSIENPETSSNGATNENCSNLCQIETYPFIKQEKVTCSPSKTMTEIPNLAYDNMRDFRQFLVVKRRVIIHNNGLRKTFRHRRARFESSNTRSVQKPKNGNETNENRQRRQYKKRAIDKSNKRESLRIKKLLGSKISLDKNKEKSTKSKNKKNKAATSQDDDLNTKENKNLSKRGYVGQCCKCGKPYEMYPHLKRHEAECTSGPSKIYNRDYSVIERIYYKCVMCSFKSIFKELFKKHISKHIMGSEKQLQKQLQKLETRSRTQCKGIKKNCNTKDKRKDTIKETYLQNQMMAFCPTCEEDTLAIEEVTQCKNCRSNVIFWCTLCRADFLTYGDVQLHVLRNLVVKPHKRGCITCGERIFKSACAQARHRAFCKSDEQCQGIPYVRLIRGEMLMKVVKAPPYTLQSYCLECNVKKIAFEKKEECVKCGFLLKFKCNICKKELVTYSDLQTHVKNVHGIDSHQCSECGQVFGHKTLLKRHLSYCNKIHGYYCTFCNIKHNSQDLLVSHVERCHINKENDATKCLDYDCKQIVNNVEQFLLMENQFLKKRKSSLMKKKQFERQRTVSEDSEFATVVNKLVADLEKHAVKGRSIRQRRIVIPEDTDIHQNLDDSNKPENNELLSDKVIIEEIPNNQHSQPSEEIQNIQLLQLPDENNELPSDKVIIEEMPNNQHSQPLEEIQNIQLLQLSDENNELPSDKVIIEEMPNNQHSQPSEEIQNIQLLQLPDENNELPSDKVIIEEMPNNQHSQPSEEIQNIQLLQLPDTEVLENIHSQYLQTLKKISDIPFQQSLDSTIVEDVHTSCPSEELEDNLDGVEGTTEKPLLHTASAPPNQNIFDYIRKFCKVCNETMECKKDLALQKKQLRKCHKCKKRLYYECKKCNLVVPYYGLIIPHVRKNCQAPKTINCSKCSYVTIHSTILKAHMKKYHVSTKHGHNVDCERCEGIHIKLHVAELATCNVAVKEIDCNNEMLVCPVDVLKVECDRCMTSKELPKMSRDCEHCKVPFSYRCLICTKRSTGSYLQARHHIIDVHRLHSIHTCAGRELLEREKLECRQPAKNYECLDCGLKFTRLARFTRHIELTCMATQR